MQIQYNPSSMQEAQAVIECLTNGVRTLDNLAALRETTREEAKVYQAKAQLVRDALDRMIQS